MALWHANQWVSKVVIGIPHMLAFDRNLHQDPRGKSIKGNSLWNIQSYASADASGPSHSFCLAIPMWQSKWISMTILFLKRLRVAHFYWWISIRTWQKVLWNWLPPPHSPLITHSPSSIWPSGICVSSVYECGHRNVHISRNHFILPSRAVLVRAQEGMHPRWWKGLSWWWRRWWWWWS